MGPVSPYMAAICEQCRNPPFGLYLREFHSNLTFMVITLYTNGAKWYRIVCLTFFINAIKNDLIFIRTLLNKSLRSFHLACNTGIVS